MRRNYDKLYGAIYAVVFMVTFGHAWHHLTSHSDEFLHADSSFLCALVWPLYWSVQAWS